MKILKYFISAKRARNDISLNQLELYWNRVSAAFTAWKSYFSPSPLRERIEAAFSKQADGTVF